MKIATLAVHAGAPVGANAPITTPIVQSTTFRFESAEAVQRYARGEGGLYMYSRDENPTVRTRRRVAYAVSRADSRYRRSTASACGSSSSTPSRG